MNNFELRVLDFKKFVEKFDKNIVMFRYKKDTKKLPKEYIKSNDTIDVVFTDYINDSEFATDITHHNFLKVDVVVYINLLNYKFDKYRFIHYLSNKYVISDFEQTVGDDYLIITFKTVL